MDRKKKKILFISCCLLFAVFAPIVLFYSQGYRFDFREKKLVKTGGIFLKAAPKQVNVDIGQKTPKRTDLFFGTLLLEGLLPKEYPVRIKKDGYQSWEKKLEVLGGEVTKAENIFLLPENLRLELIEKNIVEVWPSPDKTKIVFLQKTAKVDPETQKEIEAIELKSLIISEKKGASLMPLENAAILEIDWDKDSSRILVKTLKEEEKEQERIWLMDGLFGLPIISSLNFLPEENHEIYFHPGQETKLLFTQPEEGKLFSLWEIDLRTRLSKKILENVFAFNAQEDGIFWLNRHGFLNKTDFDGRTIFLTPFAFELKKETDYELIVLEGRVFIRENQTIFLFETQSQAFEKIANNASHLILSPDKKKICLHNGYESGIYFLEKTEGQPLRQKGDYIFLTRLSQKIENFYWWNNHYLVFKNGAAIKMIEIDNRDSAQIWTLASVNNPLIFFNQKSGQLYLWDNNNLFLVNNL